MDEVVAKINHQNERYDAAGINSGIEMIRRQFEQTFKDLGVEEIKAEGE